MTQMTLPPKIEIIPANAPFSEGQRLWLNGFLVGMLGLDGSTPLSPIENGAVLAPQGDGDDGEAPWHDPSMAIADRMKLAEGRPLRRRMMAAMAQQDCGQCGYNCADYSDSIANRSEARLNLCAPGGKETARMLKQLFEELDKAPAAKPAVQAAPTASAPAAPEMKAEPGRARENPAEATFLSRRLLKAYLARRSSKAETFLAFARRHDDAALKAMLEPEALS